MHKIPVEFILRRFFLNLSELDRKVHSAIKFFSYLALNAQDMQYDILKHGNDTGLTFTKKANANFADKFKLRITNVFDYFPELHKETVYVGWIAPRGWTRGCCYCTNETTNRRLKISLQPNETNFTIAHEFTHLLQATKKEELGIPTGERACDIWALTRLPLDLIDDYPSYIGNYSMRNHWKVMRKTVRELAFRAIEVRKSKRHYILWLEEEIKKLSVSQYNREDI